MSKVIFIAGPTSSGKTSLALKLCKKFNGEIVSADSRQIYKYFDVGTGKIPIGSDLTYKKGDNCWKLDDVNVWLYDVVEPKLSFSVVDYKYAAERAIADITARGKIPFIVGGTGFYLNSLLGYEIDVEEPRNEDLRAKLEAKSLNELQDMIPLKIKGTLNNSDFNNKIRLIRKIELLESGFEFKKRKVSTSPLEKNLILLNRSREEMYKRVDDWVDLIWIPLKIEIKNLIDLGFKETSCMKGIIYKTALKQHEQQISEVAAKERIKFDLHAYIRRQETWFKRYKTARILNPDKEGFDSIVPDTVRLILDERKSTIK